MSKPSASSSSSEAPTTSAAAADVATVATTATTDAVKKPTASASNYFTGDLLAGIGVSLFVSPFVTTIDKAVVHAANGKAATIREGLVKGWKEMATKPWRYFARKEYILVFGLYRCVRSEEIQPINSRRNPAN